MPSESDPALDATQRDAADGGPGVAPPAAVAQWGPRFDSGGLVTSVSRWLIAVVLAIGCGGQRPKAACPELERFAFGGGGALGAKLHDKLKQDLRGGVPRGFEMVFVVDVVAGDAQRLRAIGAHDVRPVGVAKRGRYGVNATRLAAGEASDSWLVRAPVEAILFVAALPWVTAIAPAIEWPGDLGLAPEIERRLDPALNRALRTFGDERPYAVGAIGKSASCLDATKNDQLARLGAIVGSVIEAPDCSKTIFTFQVPLGSLVDLVSLPWIQKLEGGGRMHPERDRDTKNRALPGQ